MNTTEEMNDDRTFGADDFVTLSLENTAYANNTPSPFLGLPLTYT